MTVGALAASAMVCHLLVRYESLHLTVTGDRPGSSRQKFHTRTVPRVGGIGAMCGVCCAAGIGLLAGMPEAPFAWAMIGMALPAFLGGLAEDVTRRVGPTPRLLLTMVSAAIAFVWLDAHLYRSHMGWLDAALSYWLVSFGATLFAVAGVAHSMNLIDGYNGLSAGVGVLVLLGFGVISAVVGDPGLTMVSFSTASAYAGFLMFNYPRGRIFLGDGGAYLLGTVIAIVAALLVARHQSVSPWFPFALVIYPVWETVFSILRRVFYQRISAGTADARHLHSLIYRRVLRSFFRLDAEAPGWMRNAMTTLPLWMMQVVIVAAASFWFDSTRALQCVAATFVVAYCALYVWIVSVRRPFSDQVHRYLLNRTQRVEAESR